MQPARFARAMGIARWAPLALVALLALLAPLALASCKKEGSSSALDAILPKGTAAKLSKDLVVLAEDLPADVDAFGFVDFGQPLGELSRSSLGHYDALYRDLAEMTKRRWGVDVDKLGGVGVVVHKKKPLFVAALAGPPPAQSQLTGKVMVGQLGRVTVLGEPDAVASILAAAKQGKRLYQEQPAWLRAALVHAVDDAIFFSGSIEKVTADAPAKAKDELANLLYGTATIGAAGLALHVTAKPGTVDKVKTLVETGLGMFRAQLDREAEGIPTDGPGPTLRILYRHYSQAFWKSLEQKVNGDELSLTVGWHAPEMPSGQAPVPFAERVALADELAVLQLSFGGPITEQLIALTDFLKAPLDRKALRDELAAEIGKAFGVPGIDPRAITASAGPSGFVISLHNAKLGEPGTQIPLLGGATTAIATPWGFAVSPLPTEFLTAAIDAKAPGLDLSKEKNLASADRFGAAFVDLSKLPADMPLPAGLPPLRSVSLVSGLSSFSADVVTSPGQAQAFVKWLEGLPALILPPGIEEMYQNRAKGGPLEEAMAILQHFQLQQVRQFTKPSSIEGDRVTFQFSLPASQMRMVLVSGIIGGIGAGAALAIPYFMMRQSFDDLQQQLPPPPSDDPNALPPPAVPAEADADPAAAPSPAQ